MAIFKEVVGEAGEVAVLKMDDTVFFEENGVIKLVDGREDVAKISKEQLETLGLDTVTSSSGGKKLHGYFATGSIIVVKFPAGDDYVCFAHSKLDIVINITEEEYDRIKTIQMSSSS